VNEERIGAMTAKIASRAENTSRASNSALKQHANPLGTGEESRHG